MPASPPPRNVPLLVLLGAAAAAVVAAGLLWSGGSSGVVPLGTATAEPALRRGTAEVRTSDLDDPPSAIADDEGTIDRTEVAPEATPGDGPVLTVVEKATSRPVPAAEVFFATGRNARFGRGDRRHWALQVLDSAPHLIADARGQVALPAVERQMFVVARSEGLFGVTTIRGDPATSTVELEPDRTVRVRVSASNRPCADVEVVLAVDRVHRLDERVRGRTDATGIVELPHVQLYRTPLPRVDAGTRATLENLLNQTARLELTARQQRELGGDPGEQLRVELREARRELREATRALRGDRSRERGTDVGPPAWAEFVVATKVPQLTPAIARFPEHAVPDALIELRLGTVGSLAVRLVGPGGEPLLSPCHVTLRRSSVSAAPGTIAPALVDSLRQLTATRVEKPFGDHLVRFAPIGAGTSLDVRVDFRDDDFSFEQDGVPGPVDTEERVIEIAMPPWFATITGRLVDAEARPRADLRADLLVLGTGGRIEGETITTDAEGRFELPVRLREPAPPYTLEVQARAGEQPIGALVAVPVLETGRRHDVGDVHIAELPLLAHGTVRDDRGEPLARVDVQLQVLRSDAQQRERWHDVTYVRARTEADGTFRLHGELRSEPMRVRARRNEHATVASPPFAFGTRVDLTLTRLGSLVASGHAPEWLPRGAIELVVSRDGRDIRDEGLRTRQNGTFRAALRRLEPGAYDVACTLRGIGTVIRIPGVVIEPSGTTRLEDLDLRNAVFRYEVVAVDQTGAPVHDPGSPLLAHIVEPGGTMRWVGFPWRGDRVEFFSTRRSASVVALASGHRPVRAEIAPGESRLTFARLNPIEIALPGLRRMVGDRRVRISLVFDGDTGLPMTDFEAVDQRRGRGRGYPRASLGKSSGAWLGQEETVRVPLMLNGRYRVVARISEPGKPGNVSKDIGIVDAVLDRPEVQRAVVAAPPAVVQQALAELAAR